MESSPNKRVTIRTIDVGGDKQLSNLAVSGEANPFMGFPQYSYDSRAPRFFRTQIRAILRAAVHGDVSLLFPMISRVEEVTYLRRFLDDTLGELSSQNIPHQADIQMGIMVEIPAVALGLDRYLDLVDFVSIGSNDLIQYLMAADRDNPEWHTCANRSIQPYFRSFPGSWRNAMPAIKRLPSVEKWPGYLAAFCPFLDLVCAVLA